MRSIRYELLRPDEIIAAKEKFSVVYLPVAPLEWHGPALPIGTDPLLIETVARLTAEKIGGVVLPTLFLGTERERAPEMLASIGFEDTSQYIVGMDFPKNTMPSMYAREDIFAITVREYVRLLVKQEYKLIAIMNGHGATGQVQSLDRLCAEFNGESSSRVIQVMGLAQNNEVDFQSGHATKFETAVNMFLDPDSVDLTKLPPKPVKIKSVDYGMVDGVAFFGRGSSDKTVMDDPRDATGDMGKEYIDTAVRNVSNLILSTYAKL